MDDLTGLWDTTPFDYGVMESHLLALRPDGTGWSVLMNAGGAEATQLTWQCPAPGTLILSEHEYTSGDWRDGTFRPDGPPSPYAGTERCPFTIAPVLPPISDAPVLTLHLDGAVGFAPRYALLTRGPVPSRPAAP